MRDEQSERLAVIGVGQALRGDDAAGPAVIERLQAVAANRPEWWERLLLIPAGAAPENFTGRLRRFKPQRVIFIDAALMGLEPGEWRYVDWRDARGYTGSTHTLPLNLLGQYIEHELGCTVELVGIQPWGNALDQPLSPAVAQAVQKVSAELLRRIGGYPQEG